MTVRDALTRWLKVYQDEVGVFLWSALLLCLIRSSGIIFANFAETAFLKRFGVEYLPLVTATNAVITFVVMGALTGVLTRMACSRVLCRALLFAGASVGALRFVVPLGFDLVYPLLYVLKTQYDVLLAFLFWNLANDLFSTRQSKRIFPLVTAGGLFGAIVGSVCTPVLAAALSSDNLLLAYGAFTAAAAWVSQRIGALFPTEVVVGVKAPGGRPGTSMLAEFAGVIPILRESSLAKILLFLTLLPNIISPIVGYQFSFVIDHTFASEGGMLDFYSYFRGAQNVIALLISLFVGRIYGRFGLPIALLFHPANYGVVFLSFLVWFNVYSAMYCGISTNVLRTTINAPATNALYGLFPMRQRALIRPFLRGTVVRVGILVGSGVVWLTEAVMHPRYLSLVALACVAGWVVSAIVLKSRYPRILIDLLSRDSLDLRAMEEGQAEEIFRGTKLHGEISDAFARARGSDAVWYARLLHDLGAKNLDSQILEKLATEDDATRLELLPLLSSRAGEPALDAFRRLADVEKPELLVALARTAKRVYADMPLSTQRQIFERARHPEVKGCFLPGLLAQAPSEYAPILEGWLVSDDPAERRAAALGAGESGRADYLEGLRQLLEREEDASVIPLLLRGMAALGGDRINEQVSPYLSHSSEEVREAAIAVWVVADEASAGQAVKLLGDPSDAVREEAIRKLEETSLPVAPLLVRALAAGGARTREAVFRLAESLDLKDVEVFRFCVAAIERAYRDLAMIDAVDRLPESPERDLLLEHLEQRKDLRIENVLRGLAAHDRTGRMRTVWRGLSSMDSRQRGNSLEALDTLLDRSLTTILLPLLENTPLAERLAYGRKRFGIEVVDAAPRSLFPRLFASEDPVTVLLSLNLAVKRTGEDFDSPELERLSRAEDEAVRTAAARLLNRGGKSRQPKEAAMGDSLEIPDRILHLKKIDILENLPVAELAAIARIAEEVDFPAGAVVVKQGKVSPRLGLLISGEVSASRSGEDGTDTELGRFLPGESFGAFSVLTDTPAQATLRSVSESRFLVVGKEAFQEMLRDYPSIAINLCSVLGKRLMNVLERVGAREEGKA